MEMDRYISHSTIGQHADLFTMHNSINRTLDVKKLTRHTRSVVDLTLRRTRSSKSPLSIKYSPRLQEQTTSTLSNIQHSTIYFILIFYILIYSSRTISGQPVSGVPNYCENEGEVVDLPLIKDIPCLTCMCKDMKVQCSLQCQARSECSVLVNKKGKCCPVCPTCEHEREMFNTSTSWLPSKDDPCQRLYCQDGFLTRAERQCYTECEHPLPPSTGECCPSCRGCSLGRMRYRDGSSFPLPSDLCAKCTCDKGTIRCVKDSCPVLSCEMVDARMTIDGCCLECVGQRIRPELKQGDCRGPSSAISDGEVQTMDECTTCTCKNGTMICDRMTCPITIGCSISEWVYLRGACCPKCPEDVPSECVDVNSVTREHGSSWQEGENPCWVCTCVNATITCAFKRCPSEPITCEEGSTPELVPGQCCTTCVSEPGICSVFGDPHYRTFDGRPFNYQGDCSYVIAKDCLSMNFTVVVENDARTSRAFSWTKAVYLTLMSTGNNGEEFVSLHQHLVAKVNKRRVSLPYMSKTIAISIERYILKVRTQTGVSLNWDGDSFLEIGAPPTYQGLLCGLCGNYNGFQRDDYIGGDGLFKIDKDSFAESWKVDSGTCSRPDYSAGVVEPCSQSLLMKVMARKKCLIFKSIEFRVCYNKVDPVEYHKSCLTDSCECPPNHKCSCESILAYTRACTRKGVTVQWNRPEFCKKSCRRGKVYSQCGPSCKRTCKNYKRIKDRRCTKMCVPGCHCPAGYAIHRKKCVKISECERALRRVRIGSNTGRVRKPRKRKKSRTRKMSKRDIKHFFEEIDVTR